MRKSVILGLAAAMLTPAVAQAQTRELDRDRREIREERRELRDAIRSGDRGDIREERRELRGAVREFRQDQRQYYRDDRRDDRRDWRQYRQANRDVFRGGGYNAPYRGWQYRPVTPGFRLQQNFYGRNYWISDPYRYRLPYPGAYHQWVRYGPDVLLIDTRYGIVREVLRSFFY
jgi:Ni/Co efflux regulator RcnB